VTTTAAKTPKKTGGNDDINKLLGAIKKKPTGPKAPASNLPDKPTVVQIKRVANRVQPRVSACYKKNNPGAGRTKVMAKISVQGATGKVTSARILTGPFSSNATGSCMASVLRSMRFDPFRRASYSFRVPFLVP
jgi:hypothetical protein